jgi:hypothetical protein
MPKLRLTEPRFRKVAGVQLRPGLQAVTDEQFRAIKAHPNGAALLEKGILEEVKAKPGRPSAEELIADIADVYDMARLRELTRDRRKTVAEAAQAQIDKINATAE